MQPSAQVISTKLRYTREADFRQERSFGSKISATFEFLTGQFRPFFKCVAYFVLPFILLGALGLAGSMFYSGQPALGSIGFGNGNAMMRDSLGLSAALSTGISGLLLMLGFMLLGSTVYAYLRVRLDTPAEAEVRPGQVGALLRARLGQLLLSWLLLLALVLLPWVLVALVSAGLLSIAGSGSLALWVMLLFLPLAWVGVTLLLYFPAFWLEDLGPLAALWRCFYLIRGKWWSSLGLYILTSMIAGLITYLFMIPVLMVSVSSTLLHQEALKAEWLGLAGMSLYSIGWVFSLCLPLVAMGFQFFNLVERRDSVGLHQLVHTLGQAAAPQVSGGTYRPDEEGEY